jgi:hypothetical protein
MCRGTTTVILRWQSGQNLGPNSKVSRNDCFGHWTFLARAWLSSLPPIPGVLPFGANDVQGPGRRIATVLRLARMGTENATGRHNGAEEEEH